MSKQLEKFIALLEEMFQFDQADLDFGIYRIMNQKREEIQKFLKNDLIPQVNQAFDKFKGYEVESIKQQLEQLEKQLLDMGVAKESSEKYQSLSAKLSQNVDTVALENEVYSHLTNFFKRYYSEGDFISQRRYKKDVYAIPYEGEEVKLHWANADQYYIKSSEQFKDYSFTLPSGKKVHFKLVEASTEQNNNKAQNGKERRFILAPENPIVEEDGELIIRFEYRIHGNNKKREVINKETIEIINSQQHLIEWVNELNETVSNKASTILEKHLNEYTARHTFDYFIHKNLGGFLRRELDFFIKNEIMFLDDIDTENEVKFELYLSKIKVIKLIGNKVIDLLAQIENFQKKLWLKKKFVLKTDYCFTIDNVPKELYTHIINNEAQIQEWIDLYAVDEINEDLTNIGFSRPLTLEFLEQNPYLIIDTVHFDLEFRIKLLSSLNDIDKQVNGVLIHSDNYQALNLLSNKYKNKVKCIYIDPPYNTDATPIIYKNGYKSSTWLSLIYERIVASKDLLDEQQGYYSVAIDDYELHNLYMLMKQVLTDKELMQVIVNHYPGSGTGRSNVSKTHEYNIFAIPKGSDILRGEIKEGGERERGFCRSGTGENNYRFGRPNSFYAVLVDPTNFEIKGFELPPEADAPYPTDNTEEGYIRVYPLGADGSERCWSLGYESAIKYQGMLKCTPNLVIKRLYFDETDRELLPSLWVDNKYSAVVHGTNLLTSLFNKSGTFSFPKSLYTVQTAITAGTFMDKEAIICDFFAGSGTTGHATINLNKEDDGNRKYILIEMGNYFYDVTKPRIQKAIYSKDWKKGKPVSREGISQIIKYLNVESYEDTLNNIEIKQSQQQSLILNEYMSPKAKEEYMLSYMLEMETVDSPSLLNIDMFTNPFDYKMKINNGTETKIQSVDLVETFNYLIGLHVETMDFVQGCQLIEGYLRDGARTLVIWRNTEEVSNDMLNDILKKLDINSRDSEYNLIYVNGDNHIQNLKLDESTWKVRLIEEEFKKLMFDVNDI